MKWWDKRERVKDTERESRTNTIRKLSEQVQHK